MFSLIVFFTSYTTNSVSHAAKKVTTKTTSRDEEFEELRNKFTAFKKAVEGVKKEAVRMQEQTKSFVKQYKELGADVEELFECDHDDQGRRFKKFTEQMEQSGNENLIGGLGEVVTSTEALINICEGLKKRISHRDGLLKDVDIAAKDKDKEKKYELKYEEACQKYEEVNDKLKGDLQESLTDGHPKFKEHYERLISAQRRCFELWAAAASEI